MVIQNRYDLVFIFDVKDGNPNGDPDAGNLPRIDVETGCGLVTDVCLKRKIRNYVSLVKNPMELTQPLDKNQMRYEIYVREKAILNKQNERAYIGIGEEELLKVDNKKRKGGGKVEEARQWMCLNFYDVRTFGAVMSTGINAGQVRGPVQLTFARSVEPIVTSEHTITRMAVATEDEAENQEGDNRTMGRKFTIPYGLYRMHGFISAPLAEQTNFNEDDLELLFESFKNMFEHDRSAARGEMTARGLYVFKHESKLGNAQAHTLFERIKISRQTEGPARSFDDYKVEVDTSNFPQGVMLERIIG
ncbi:TPA: type I-C CRISPR-associated protein Cas7/Csd2 [Legionella pneumophila]|uniref:type I-C CRISPR-associated protein Cas7/Csd2 n=1 Tax=Legionella pneumophila TaxID=446 RepID=UPI00048117AE|nr:type I-C CRISPR-associated protein Cas7/Csd2 [Legionella pneumophila]AMQ28517.1 CRISPR-associated protein Csh2 [Legionella pneumophila subsp. pneumophila]MBN5928068.1 type I-C CRISPR-associated protein Cas7/Csd2 [Legionella pneumophila]MCZ4738011.1 type I-C CRISPR-associated protein Cas7/Csd2 [Legionella pneumophila]MDI9828209.1 type I-C CRISPR-associated protein Cas7/Csd2 [Legionella pneumophila]MDO5158293.1 type I-C CRISPR-associated protein Cas7/Csd2 [Legionella pneumophila]